MRQESTTSSHAPTHQNLHRGSRALRMLAEGEDCCCRRRPLVARKERKPLITCSARGARASSLGLPWIAVTTAGCDYSTGQSYGHHRNLVPFPGNVECTKSKHLWERPVISEVEEWETYSRHLTWDNRERHHPWNRKAMPRTRAESGSPSVTADLKRPYGVFRLPQKPCAHSLAHSQPDNTRPPNPVSMACGRVSDANRESSMW